MITFHLVDNADKGSLPGLINLYAEEYNGLRDGSGKGISPGKLVGIIIGAGQFFIVAKSEGNPVGFIECGYAKNKKEKKRIEIFAYYTSPQYRRRGLAKRLTTEVILKARKENTQVITIPNPTARIRAMVARFKQMQESTPKERRAVRIRSNPEWGGALFRIKPKRKIK